MPLLPNLPRPEVEVVEQANLRTLQGALGLAAGSFPAETAAFKGAFHLLHTEQLGATRDIEKMSPGQIALSLAQSEQAAGKDFLASAEALGSEAATISGKLKNGGRVIYVGAGTSGRVAALDAVEIPCTYGVSRDRFVAVPMPR